jgi:biopolymer transport protein TolR
MNVVPYIDVMLVLLVIFMVTTPMFTPGLVDVPSVSQARAPNKQPLQVLIDKDGSYALQDDGLPKESFASLEQLISRVVEKGGSGERTVAVEANKELKYDDVMKVADKLHAAGIKKLAFTVSQKSGGQ